MQNLTKIQEKLKSTWPLFIKLFGFANIRSYQNVRHRPLAFRRSKYLSSAYQSSTLRVKWGKNGTHRTNH